MDKRVRSEPRREALVTVIIPVKNAGPILRTCLEEVFAQETPFHFDVLCIDSGSTDGSLEVIRASGARLVQIPAAEFGHGKTRNYAIAQTETPFVAMITHDAVPADPAWLRELVQPFLDDENVGGVFGPHAPHPGCNPSEAFMLARHFASFGSETSFVSIEPTQAGWQHYEANKGFYRFFSDNNAALRRSTWLQVPYPDVEFMEDQLWASSMLEAGYTKAYAPRAVVRHSHDYPLGTLLRRGFDEARFFRTYFPDEGQQFLTERLRGANGAARQDLRQLWDDPDRSLDDKVRASSYCLACHHFKTLGGYLGDRVALLPESVVRRLSQHHALRGDADERSGEPSLTDWAAHRYRGSVQVRGRLEGTARAAHRAFQIYRAHRHRGLARVAAETRKLAQARVAPARPWWQSGPYPYLEPRPCASAPAAVRRATDPSQLVVNWVIPPFGQGSGGHLNIFRMVHHLERRGHRCRIYIQDGRGYLPDAGVVLHRQVREWFAPIAAPVRHLAAEMEPADVVMATSWVTAYPVRASACAPHKAYFIQDFEPLFYARGAESQLAEDTYRFGFYGVTAGPWLEELVKTRYGMRARSFPLAVEHRDYWPDLSARVKRRRLFAYLRPATQRRAFELVALALKRIHEEHPEVEIHIAGQQLPESMLPVPCVGHGVLGTEQLRRLYSSCHLALCVSLTNYSLLPQEVVACGCPVVDVDGENTRAAYPSGAVVLAPPSVEGLAEAALKLLGDPVYHRAQVQAGLDYVKDLSWEKSATLVEQALQELVGPEVRAASAKESAVSPVRRIQ